MICVCRGEGVLSWVGQVKKCQEVFILGILMGMIDEWKAMKTVSVGGGGGGGAPGAPGAFERRRQAAGVGHLHHLHHSHHQPPTPQSSR